jgi:hypothetical protein
VLQTSHTSIPRINKLDPVSSLARRAHLSPLHRTSRFAPRRTYTSYISEASKLYCPGSRPIQHDSKGGFSIYIPTNLHLRFRARPSCPAPTTPVGNARLCTAQPSMPCMECLRWQYRFNCCLFLASGLSDL